MKKLNHTVTESHNVPATVAASEELLYASSL
jgi:hypothetical protein